MNPGVRMTEETSHIPIAGSSRGVPAVALDVAVPSAPLLRRGARKGRSVQQ